MILPSSVEQLLDTSEVMKPWLSLAAVFLLPLQLFADGKVFAPIAISAPTIPDQRALIWYSSGVERLVIETRFAGEGTNFAWVVPLPSQPVIEQATTGLFPTLAFLFQPQAINAPTRHYLFILSLLGLAYLLVSVKPGQPLSWSALCAYLLIMALAAAASPAIGICVGAYLTLGMVLVRLNTSTVVTLLMLIFFGFLLGAMMIPALGSGKAKGMDGPDGQTVSIVDRQLIGAFETTTITSEDPGALMSWLDQNGFGLPTNAQPVLDYYVSNDWVFVALKLHRTGGASGLATNTPHPLSFTFHTTQPVYPLRLTGVDSGPVSLELFVFGSDRARIPGFKAERVCRPEYSISGKASSRWGPGRDVIITHPQLREWVDGTPVATKLTARLRPDQMQQDALLEWVPFEEKVTLMYSKAAARTTGLNWGSLCLVIGTLVSCFAAGSGPRCLARMYRMILTSALLGLLIAGAIYVVLPKTEMRLIRGRWARLGTAYELGVDWHSYSFRNMAEARDALAEALVEHRSGSSHTYENVLLGGNIREEDSPGNFVLREREGQAEFVIFNLIGGEQILFTVPLTEPTPQ